MRRICLLLLAVGCLLGCVGCEAKQLEIPTSPTQSAQELTEHDLEIPALEDMYFTEETPAQYRLRLQYIFTSLFPQLSRNVELGVNSHCEVFGSDVADIPPDAVVDELAVRDYGSFTYRSSIPVFYGLLKETECYLAYNGIQYNDLAEPYGKTRAIRGQDVEKVLGLLLRKEIPLKMQSVAGAHYLPQEDLFVYNELLNPYQKFYDRGWTLEFVGSNLEYSKQFQWSESGNGYSGGTIFCFWYDTKESKLYNMYGDEMGYTNNIEGLRQEGSEDLYHCTYQPRNKAKIFDGVQINFDEDTITKSTPVMNIRVGSMLVGGVESGSVNLPPEVLDLEETIALESDFFDDYYHDPLAGDKVTNYFLGCFYERPEEIDVTVLPTKDVTQLERWCQTYLGIELSALKADPQTVGTKKIPIPYFTIWNGEQQGNRIIVNYYNEILRCFAVLTLQWTEDGYQFVSNLPS